MVDNPGSYDTSVCRSDSGMEASIEAYAKSLQGAIGAQSNEEAARARPIVVMPYCNERLVRVLGTTWPALDGVNRPATELAAIKAMEKHIGVRFDTRTCGLSDDGARVCSHASDVHRFLGCLESLVRSVRSKQRHVVVVTHSSFLTELVETLTNGKPRLDNLDIVGLRYAPDEKGELVRTRDVEILRYPNYANDETERTERPGPPGPLEPTGPPGPAPGAPGEGACVRVSLMRHCVACHNHPRVGLVSKWLYANSGARSMCLPQTAEEMKKAREGLLARTGPDPVVACSVIFRAMLTAATLVRVLRADRGGPS